MNPALRFPRGLYGVTPEWDDTNRLMAAVEAAATGGMVALQWRRKTLASDHHLPQALALAALCKRLGVLFIVNDDWRLATTIDADGVHLGREDGSLREARQALGEGKIVGCSCYNDLAMAELALSADVDYIAFGAMYPSSIKPQAVSATLDDIRQARSLVDARATNRRAAVVAIGGLSADNAAPVIQAGADSIALISSLFNSTDIHAAAARCRALFL